jgi:uncharacterized repeat protein (TIGR03803 family)
MQSKRSALTIICIVAAALASRIPLRGQTLNTIYSFGHNELGSQPTCGVTIGPNGELYGTTPHGGATGFGVVYELTPPSSPGGAWTETVLHSFSGQTADGAPSAELLIGKSGVLYGVTGTNAAGDDGTVFQLKPPAGTGTHWRETVLHAFTDSNGDGALPEGVPVFGPHSALYGTTTIGSTNPGGTVYRLVPPTSPGGVWTEQVLHSFTGYDGETPAGPLALGGDGAIYGATIYGGTGAAPGVIFQLAPPTAPGGSWTETVLYEFGSQSGDWGLPNGVVVGPNGVLYGTAIGGQNGNQCPNGCGTAFQINPPSAPGSNWTETILHTFAGMYTGDGSQPNSVPVPGPGGVLYGTTLSGGTTGHGTIFEMLPPPAPGGSWSEVVLYSFSGGADGWEPNAVALGPDGNLYGTTQVGGVSKGGIRNQGTVFQLVLQ